MLLMLFFEFFFVFEFMYMKVMVQKYGFMFVFIIRVMFQGNWVLGFMVSIILVLYFCFLKVVFVLV